MTFVSLNSPEENDRLHPAPLPNRRVAGDNIIGYIIVWSVAITLALAAAGECHSIFDLSSLLYGIVLWCWWGIIGCALWWMGARTLSGPSLPTKALTLHLALAAVLSWLHQVALWGLGLTGLGWYSGLSPQGAWSSLVNIHRWGSDILTYGFILGIVTFVQSRIRAQQEMLRSVELQRQLSATQLRVLQMQMEPHFLFNTLNAITTLVELGRQRQAAEMLRRLNAILKRTLQGAGPEKTPLSQELEMVENYLAIEQIRFSDRLRVELKVEPSTLDSLVPCFLLQPLVENAIRHGIANYVTGGLVQTTAKRDGDFLRLEVRDSGSSKHPGPEIGNGIGLKNTRERLAHFYSNSYEMNAHPTDVGFAVTIRIPYERSQCN